MSAIRAPGTAGPYRAWSLAEASLRILPNRGARPAQVGPESGPIASEVARSLLLIAIALILVLVVLPAVLGAAGTWPASGA